jgi:hypothetical protein
MNALSLLEFAYQIRRKPCRLFMLQAIKCVPTKRRKNDSR